jgi:hypothetical protein
MHLFFFDLPWYVLTVLPFSSLF